MKTTTVHVYAGDGIPDYWGKDRCARPGCALPRTHEVHDVPERTEEERAIGARILGETQQRQEK